MRKKYITNTQVCIINQNAALLLLQWFNLYLPELDSACLGTGAHLYHYFQIVIYDRNSAFKYDDDYYSKIVILPGLSYWVVKHNLFLLVLSTHKQISMWNICCKYSARWRSIRTCRDCKNFAWLFRYKWKTNPLISCWKENLEKN